MGDVSQDAHTPFQRAARGLERAVGIVSRVAIALAGAACLTTLGMVSYAIIMRYFFNQPQSWTDETVGWLVVMTVMLAIPEAQRRGEHIGVDALTEKLGPRGKRWAAMVGVATVAIVAYLFLTEGIETVTFTRMIGIVSNVLPEVPLWAVQALVPIGGALLLMVTVAQLLCYLAGLEPRTVHKTKPDALE
jgi:TRAP-type C4-dicarboxylate transport system permease small subunit